MRSPPPLRARASAIFLATKPSMTRMARRKRRCLGRGKASGSPGLIPRVGMKAKAWRSAAPTSSPPAPRSTPNMARLMMLMVSAIISSSMVSGASARAQRSSSCWVTSTIIEKNWVIAFGVKEGCMMRRWVRHSSPSLVTRPCPSSKRRPS
jgi:hypothetical protein